MLQIKPKKNVVYYVLLFFVFFFCIAKSAIANNDFDQLDKLLQSLGMPQTEEGHKNEKHVAKILQAFKSTMESNDGQTKELLMKWENHIKSVSHFSNTDYANAINKQLIDYLKAISDIGSIITKNKDRQANEYSSSWIDDLTNNFGKNFVKNNRNMILDCYEAVIVSNEDFEKKLKDLIYMEAMLNGTYKNYFGMFLSFYNQELSDNERKIFETHKNIAESFLVIINKTPLTSIHNTTVLRKVLTENKARQLNEELYMFLNSHPLSHTFGDSRALEDLMKAIEN